MKASIQAPIAPGVDDRNTFGWIVLLLELFCLPFAIWGFFTLFEGRASDTAEFCATAILLVSAATGYLTLRGLSRIPWTSIPVLLTIEMVAAFVIVPVMRFASGDDVIDADYARAMFLALIGYVTFAIGSLAFVRHDRLHFVPRVLDTPDRVSFVSAAMLGLGTLGTIVVWKIGLLGYTADASTQEASSGIMQWVNSLAALLTAALVISAIEVLGKRSREPLIRIVFWLSLLVSIGFGVLSGMKAGPLVPPLLAMFIYGITRGRIPRAVLLLPVFLILFIYPFTNAYRENLNSGYRGQVNTAGGMEAVLVKSFGDAFLTYGSGSKETGESNFDLASSRLAYLGCLRDIIEVPYPEMLNGDEKIWLAPVYPLVPRFLWKNKPVLDKGHRLSAVLGRGSVTSSAPTFVGDLYSVYGMSGVVIGMFVWGALLQAYMNWIGQSNTSEKNLFIYIVMLPQLMNLESDVIALLVGIIQTGIVALIISYLIYGHQASRVLPSPKPSLAGRS